MRQYPTLGVATCARFVDVVGWAPVLTSSKKQVVSRLLRAVLAAIGAWIVLAAASPAWAFLFGAYQFREVASTTGPFAFIGTPSINDTGTVAAHFILDGGGEQLLTQQSIIAETGAFSTFGGGRVSINNDGIVVFSGISSSNSGIFASSGGLITTIVDNSGSYSVNGTAIEIASDFDLSDSGDLVVFRARLESDRGGIYSRNVAGGPIFTRIEADSDEFVFEFPAINAQNKMATLMSFLGGGVSRQQIVSDLGTLMDTNNEFDLPFPYVLSGSFIDMNNANTVAFKARLDSGDFGIFKSVNGAPATTVVDASGPFDDFFSPSVNIGNTVAFLATFDVGNARGIFNGPDPVNNKIIGVGDVFQTKSGAQRTVTSVGGFGNDGLSKHGRVAFTVQDQNGDQYLVSGARALTLDIDFDNVVQLTTAMDEKREMMQDFTFPSFATTELKFDYRILTPEATLFAYINDILVGSVVARGSMSDFATRSIPINPLTLFGEILPELLTLKLEVVGGAGMTVQLDNIEFADIENGDFETGDLSGWRFDGGGGAAMVTNGLDLVFVPEPATSMLGLFGLFASSLAFGRRRG